MLAHMGQHQGTRETLAAVWPRYQLGPGAVDELAYAVELAALLEVAVVLGEWPIAAAILPSLADCPGVAGGGTGLPASAQRLVAGAYALLGQPEQARLHYQRAIEACTHMRFRPELALTRLELAELLLDSALTPTLSQVEREEAQAHLDFAIEEFRAMKMQPSLERALRHKGLLHA